MILLAQYCSFLVQVECIAGRRSEPGSGDDASSSAELAVDRLLSLLLVEIDGASTPQPGAQSSPFDVVVVATTHDLLLVEPALLRSGRLDQHVELGFLSEQGREDSLRQLLQHTPLSCDLSETSTDGSVAERDGKYYHTETGEELNQIVAKMSKSLKNVVNPDDVIEKYGADSLRLYEMFMGPLDERKPWAENGVKGVHNFLNRAFRFFADTQNIAEGNEDKEVEKLLHQTIQKVESDIENLKFNTAISALMVFNNLAIKKGKVTKNTAQKFARVLSPFAPHLGEELWSVYGNIKTLAYEPWPAVNENLLQENTHVYPVSFNGKVRFKIELPLDMPKNEVEKTILSDERSQKWLKGKKVRKFIFVPKKIINVAVG